MAKLIFVYHGSSEPEFEAQMKEVLSAWNAWFAQLDNSVIDAGNPLGQSNTVHSNGSITQVGGSNPVSGYSFIIPSDIEDTSKKRRGPYFVGRG